MRLGRLLKWEAKERAEELIAKKKLENKLGRKVTTEELYSLGSHLDAAGDIDPSKPLISTPREASTPFADAKPPMKLSTKLILIGIPLLLLTMCFGGTAINMMSKQTINRLNPFGVRPPEGVFPAAVGEYKLQQTPDYYEPSSYDPVPRFTSVYKKDKEEVRYNVKVYNSEDEAAAAYDKLKNESKDGTHGKIAERSDNRVFFAGLSGWDTYIYFRDGKYLKTINAFNQSYALNFEGFLKNQPPQAVVSINESDLPKPAPTKQISSNIAQLLDKYKSVSAADFSKYKNGFIDIYGTVDVSARDKNGKWFIAFMRPGADLPNKGMLLCSVEKNNESSVINVKKGDVVHLKGTFFSSLAGNVLFKNCSKI